MSNVKHPRARRRNDAELKIRLTHPDRVVFTDPDITKRDLALFYARIASSMLPHVAGRPLAILRCPTGTNDGCFFQKHPPAGLPATVKRIAVLEKQKEAVYLQIDDAAGLVALVQHGGIEIHVWGARSANVEKPDRLVFDLDPDPAVGWKDVVQSAIDLREVLADLELVSFVKTTGGKGLHVVVPIMPRNEWPAVKNFCRSIAAHLAKASPSRFTSNPLKAQRRGKIFIDYLRNDRGAVAVAPYSVRAQPRAPVAMPIAWEELRRISGPQQFTIQNSLARVERRTGDPWQKLLTVRQPLPVLRQFQ